MISPVIHQWLNQFTHPYLVANWSEYPRLVTQLSTDKVDKFTINLPFYIDNLETELASWIENNQYQLQEEYPTQLPQFEIKTEVVALQTLRNDSIAGIKNIIAVTSAKGGVGKSTTAVNLALSLLQLGTNGDKDKSHAKVGLLDADLYGPSVPMMLGTQERSLNIIDDKWMQPVEVNGLHTNSIGYLMSATDAAVWRGPMASKALMQLVNETKWPDLDYLVIDMPPGTGDIQLTLSQQIPLTSALIVTTPQDLALADAIKGEAMFKSVDVPVLGIIENMSYHICSNCGHHEAIFGEGGAEKMATNSHLPLLAQIPLHIKIRSDIDNGKPTVMGDPENEFSQIYRNLAADVVSKLYWQGKARLPEIAIKVV